MKRTKLLAAGFLFVSLGCLLLQGDATHSASVSIGADGFDPLAVTLKIPGSVTWTNNDDRDHNVTADDGSFQSGNLKPGKSFTYSFSKAGQFPYGCTLHPREKGMVIVQN